MLTRVDKVTELKTELSQGMSFGESEGRFSIYSQSASQITLVLLGDKAVELALERSGDIWQVQSELIKPGIRYAIRAAGPDGPRHGFRPELNLIDPYARGVIRQSARDYVNVAIQGSFDWQQVAKPNRELSETVIYEAHLRGLTRGNSELPDELRGTYAALGHPSTISQLSRLGITAIELLPIQMFISEPRLMNLGLINYWGYNTINFFSPHPRYASAASLNRGPEEVIRELKTSIRELHRAGIEVIMDVVYNHTAEGGSGGLTYSFRGIDNSSYYRQDDDGNYIDTTGCGNSLDFSNPQVVNLVIDSLRYWSEEFQIDGFRFDLATTLARDENNHFNPRHRLLQALEHENFAQSKLIVEPWDVGLGGWQTGHFPDRFSEWNDRYRDDVRKFWLTDVAFARHSGHYPNGVANLATKLSGSVDVVDGPHGVLAGVNFITAHDGFTLRDLVSYDVKHNQVNGESNRDGSNNNYSFNFGIEGETDNQEVNQLRRRVARNLLGTLLFSSGIPMLTAGDERGKTQLGNNNAYCQDNTLSWLNWELATFQKDLEATTAFLIELRQRYSGLRPKQFANYELATSHSDRMRWFSASGELMSDADWFDDQCRTLSRLTDHLLPDGSLQSLVLIVHGSEQPQQVMLPKLSEFSGFELLWDSSWERPKASSKIDSALELAGLSVALLLAQR